MVLKYLASNYERECKSAASAWARCQDSDPFAYGRAIAHLALRSCSQGLPSDVLADAKRIMSAREKAAPDPSVVQALCARLGLKAAA